MVELAVGLKIFLWGVTNTGTIHKYDRFSHEQQGENREKGVLSRRLSALSETGDVANGTGSAPSS